MTTDMCDYEITTEKLPEELEGWSCGREVWTDADQANPTKCIWHVKQDRKPTKELVAALEREDRRNESWSGRFDGAHLRGAAFPGEKGIQGEYPFGRPGLVSLPNCTFVWADLTDAHLNGANLYEAQLDWTELKGIHLEGALLYEAQLNGTNLRAAHLTGANLEGASLDKTVLEDAHLNGANLKKAHLDGGVIIGAHLNGANLERAHLNGAFLHEAHLNGAFLHEAHLNGANLKKAHLDGAYLTSAYFNGADFQEAHLNGASLSSSHLNGASLSSSHLNRANLGWAQLNEAFLINARLNGANLRNAHLNEALLIKIRLNGADLKDGHFDGANLEAASLDRATLGDASFKGAILEDTSLEKADLRSADLTNARWHLAFHPDIRINDETTFGDRSVYEQAAKDATVKEGAGLEGVDEAELWERATWTYSQLDLLFRENAMATQARRYHFRQGQASRRYHWAAAEGLYDHHRRESLIAFANRLLTGYGDRFRPVFGWIIGVIVLSAVLYLLGGFTDAAGSHRELADLATAQGWQVAIESLLLSISVFGFGSTSATPTGYSTIVEIFESLFGAFLFGLVGFVLARRLP